MTHTGWLVLIYVVAMLVFIVAAFGVTASKVNLIALGLAIFTLAFMLKAAGVL